MMMKKSYAEDIKGAEVMSAGLKSNAAKAAEIGLGETFTADLDTKKDEVTVLNNEQERLKAELKLKTEALEKELSAMNAAVTLARKRIKIDFPQAQWVEFGIEAKR